MPLSFLSTTRPSSSPFPFRSDRPVSLYRICIQRCEKQPCHDQRNLSEKRKIFGIVEREPLGTQGILDSEVSAERLVNMLRVDDGSVGVVAPQRDRVDLVN